MPLTTLIHTKGAGPQGLALLPLGGALFLVLTAYSTAFAANNLDRAGHTIGTDFSGSSSYAFIPGGTFASRTDTDITRYSLQESQRVRGCTPYFL